MPYARVKNELPLIPGYAAGDMVSISDAVTGSFVNTLTAEVSGSGCNVCNVTDNASYFNGLTKGTYGFVDLGTISFSRGNRNNDDTAYIFYASLANMKNATPNAISDGFIRKPDMTQWETLKKGEFGTQANFIIFADDYSSASDFRTAVSGVYLIYELATATTPTITPIQYNDLLTAFGYSGYMMPITFPSSVASGSITINADGSVDLTSEGTTTRLTDTANPSILSGTNNIWVDTGDIENLVYVRRNNS